MIFSGGLVPTYLLMQQLHLVNTIWGVVIPGCVGVWNLVVTRTFFEENIPVELFESAQLDGCGHFRFFLYIVLPLSGVIIAVIALFYGVNQWNGFFNALVYLNDKNKFPLQLFLRDILLQQEMMSMDPDLVNAMRHQSRSCKICNDYCSFCAGACSISVSAEIFCQGGDDWFRKGIKF